MHTLATVAAIIVALVVAVVAGTRMIGSGGATASGGNALGGLDVFNPARERSEHDMESQKHQTVVTPATGDDDDRPLRVDTDRNTVRIKRPVTEPSGRSEPEVPTGPQEPLNDT